MNGCDVETAAERRWDFVADPPTRLLAELNLARARMCRSEWREARRAAVRLLRHLDADSTSAMPALMPARRAELRADGLAVEAVTATLLERKEASEVLNDSVVAYEQLLGQAGSLRPSGLAGYGMVLALAGRPRDAVDPLVHAAEAGQDVLMELVLRVADQLLSHGERTSAIRLLRAVRERYPDEPQLAAALADAYHQDGQDQATAAAHVDAGSLLAEMGQLDNARDHFDLAMQAVPDHPRAVLGHCQALVAVGRTEEALARVGELQRSQPLLAGAWVVGALATLELGRPADALEIVDQALAQFSDDLWLLDARAHVLVALGRHREAIEAVDMALAVDPTDRLWRGLRAELSIVVDEAVDASLQILRELAAATPTAAQPSARLIRALRATGHPQQALEVVGTAQRAQPDNIGLLVPEVELLREVGRAEDAVDKAGQALERGVAHELLGLPLAHALLDVGDAVAAQRIVEAAMVDSRRAHAILGLAHLAVGEPERAVPELELAIGDPAWSPRVDVALAECLVALGRAAQSDDLDGAIERFERAVALDPASLSARQSAAEAYRVRGDFVEALEHANAGLDLDSQDGWLIGTRGQILEAMGGKEDEAEDDLRRAITLNPELHWARVELGDLLRARNRLPEAIEVLRAAVEVMPDDPWPLASLGAAEYSLDDYDAALESLSHALRLAPDYAWAHAVLSAVHADIDQLDEAHRHIARAQELAPEMAFAWSHLGWLELLDVFAGDDGAPDRQAARRAIDAYRAARELGTTVEDDVLYAEACLAAALDDDATEVFEAVAASVRAEERPDAAQLAALGWAELRLGNHDDAIDAFVSAIALDPTNLGTAFDLALAVLCSEGRESIAMDEYGRVLGQLASVRHPGRRRALLRVAHRDLSSLSIDQLATRGGVVDEVRALLRDRGGDEDEQHRSSTLRVS